MKLGTPYEGRDDAIGPRVYAQASNSVVLYTNTLDSLDDSTVFADLTQPAGTGYSPFFLVSTRSWDFTDGVATFNNQRVWGTTTTQLAGGAGTGFYYNVSGFISGGVTAGSTVGVLMNNGNYHTSTISFVDPVQGLIVFPDTVTDDVSIGARFYVDRLNYDTRVTFENTGSVNWSGAVTGAALIGVGDSWYGSGSKIIHFVDINASDASKSAVTVTPGGRIYVDLKNLT